MVVGRVQPPPPIPTPWRPHPTRAANAPHPPFATPLPRRTAWLVQRSDSGSASERSLFRFLEHTKSSVARIATWNHSHGQ